MKLSINTSIVDRTMESLENAIRHHLDNLEKELSKDYGGIMENLWIDLELSPILVNFHKPYKFRFQKKVSLSPPKGMGLEIFNKEKKYDYNVGHYSVRPDYDSLKELPKKDAPLYFLNLLYNSTEALLEKKKRLQGFEVERFREDFVSCCNRLGILINTES